MGTKALKAIADVVYRSLAQSSSRKKALLYEKSGKNVSESVVANCGKLLEKWAPKHLISQREIVKFITIHHPNKNTGRESIKDCITGTS